LECKGHPQLHNDHVLRWHYGLGEGKKDTGETEKTSGPLTLVELTLPVVVFERPASLLAEKSAVHFLTI